MNRVFLQIDQLGSGPSRKGVLCREEIPLGIHDDNLFDQNEDGAGELFDLATGEPYDNSTYTGLEDLTELEPVDGTDILPPIIEDDEAAAWLRKAEVEVRIAGSGLKRYLDSAAA